MSKAIKDRVQTLLSSSRFGVLSTRGVNGQPYASLVAVTGEAGLRHVVFATFRETRKFRNLCDEPRVAILVDNRANADSDLRDATAATFLGCAREQTGPRRDELAAVFLAKHPGLRDFVTSPSCALFAVEVDRINVVDRFQAGDDFDRQ